METLLIFCLELLGEFAIDEGIHAASQSKNPIWLRITLASLISVFVLSVVIGLDILGCLLLMRGNGTGVIALMLCLMLIYGIYRKCREIQTSNSKKL